MPSHLALIGRDGPRGLGRGSRRLRIGAGSVTNAGQTRTGSIAWRKETPMSYPSRREFLAASALAAGALTPIGRAFGDGQADPAPASEAPRRRVGANDKVVLGFIGVGGMGS